jgi:hypothetical protein
MATLTGGYKTTSSSFGLLAVDPDDKVILDLLGARSGRDCAREPTVCLARVGATDLTAPPRERELVEPL